MKTTVCTLAESACTFQNVTRTSPEADLYHEVQICTSAEVQHFCFQFGILRENVSSPLGTIIYIYIYIYRVYPREPGASEGNIVPGARCPNGSIAQE